MTEGAGTNASERRRIRRDLPKRYGMFAQSADMSRVSGITQQASGLRVTLCGGA